MTPKIIKKLSTDQLLTLWEMTTDIEDKSIPDVRGWLMDEMKRRNPEGFNDWLNLEIPNDEMLRYYMQTNRLCLSCRCLGGDCGGITPEAGTGCVYYIKRN